MKLMSIASAVALTVLCTKTVADALGDNINLSISKLAGALFALSLVSAVTTQALADDDPAPIVSTGFVYTDLKSYNHVVKGQFDDDGKSDYYAQDDSGNNLLSFSDGNYIKNFFCPNSIKGPSWVISGHFTRPDGQSQLAVIWRSSGRNVIANVDKSAVTTCHNMDTAGPIDPRSINGMDGVVPVDLNHDGYDDFIATNSQNGGQRIFRSGINRHDGNPTALPDLGDNSDQDRPKLEFYTHVVGGDFDGNGKQDWYAFGTNENERMSYDNGRNIVNYICGAIPATMSFVIAGNFTDPERDTLLFIQRTDQRWNAIAEQDPTSPDQCTNVLLEGLIPRTRMGFDYAVAADVNHDGMDDLLTFNDHDLIEVFLNRGGTSFELHCVRDGGGCN